MSVPQGLQRQVIEAARLRIDAMLDCCLDYRAHERL
jgi:hypothetical protein